MDRETTRRGAEERGEAPSPVSSTRSEDDPGLIRLDFPGYSDARALKEISWSDRFHMFAENDLALYHQETTGDGTRSNFNRLIKKDTAREAKAEWAEGGGSAPRSNGSSGERGGGSRASLNRAPVEDLDGVFGIGPATAKKIVAYRIRDLGDSIRCTTSPTVLEWENQPPS